MKYTLIADSFFILKEASFCFQVSQIKLDELGELITLRS